MITVRGAREHNLRNVDVAFPRGEISVVTGPSGSGKSSLVFDTLYAESQRRYVESLGTHARQYLDILPRPDVDAIDGLSPAIAVRQEPPHRNPRSTVGTITEIHDFLRVLFARVGRPHCPSCGREVRAYTAQQMVDRAERKPGARLSVRAPVVRGRVGELAPELARLRKDGFVRVVVDGTMHDLGEPLSFDPRQPHDLDVVVDRLVIKPDVRTRLTDAVELALRTSGGFVRLAVEGEEPELLSERPICGGCDRVLPPITPRSFSWNAPEGACPTCEGLGEVPVVREEPAARRTSAPRRAKGRGAAASEAPEPDGEIEPDAPSMRPCPACQGQRLRPESLAVQVMGMGLGAMCAQPVRVLASTLRAGLDGLAPAEREVATPLVGEVLARLSFLDEVGVGYLSLDRAASTLSSGEAQRIRLGTRLGGALVGVLYVLDEPSVGLHPRDTSRLLATLGRLRDQGNTVVVVEHDLDVVRAASHVVDVGPGAGVHGGRILFAGLPSVLASRSDTPTGPWLAGRRLARAALGPARSALRLEGVRLHNLRGLDVSVPLGRFVAVTGVSGSGKSSLIMHALLPAVRAVLAGRPSPFVLRGAESIGRVVAVDQSPIGRTPRSTPATYVGLMTPLRELFASLPEARARGYDAARFSANVKGGRCEACEGEGVVRVEMHLLPDVYVRCEVCHGARYNRDTLEIRYRGLSIADALALPIEEAAQLFSAIPSLRDRLATLRELGLGYLTLGQSGTTLSGGEAQRLKLAKELSRRSEMPTLYVLDEPTTGLHLGDVEALVEVLDRLVRRGHSVVVIEHAMELVACADWVIDLGPEGGGEGGQVVGEGRPGDIARTESHTGRALRPFLTS
ncbi:MAG: hypothetical protein OHK0013_43320 [Sandaracinaceae bacterium]